MGGFGLAARTLLGHLLLVGSVGRRGEMGKARLPVIHQKICSRMEPQRAKAR
jgi:hypothetical protein